MLLHKSDIKRTNVHHFRLRPLMLIQHHFFHMHILLQCFQLSYLHQIQKVHLGNKTVKLSKATITTKKDKKITIKLSDSLNMENVRVISYKAGSNKIKVSKNGKIVAKNRGTYTVTVTVTLVDGTKKVLKQKIKIK